MGKCWSFFRQFSKGLGWRYIYVALALVFVQLISLVGPYYLGRFIDIYKLEKLDANALYFCVLVLFSAVVIQYIFDSSSSYFVWANPAEVCYRVRTKLMKQYLGQGRHFFKHFGNGTLISRLLNDLEIVSNITGWTLISFIDGFVFPFFIIGTMIYQTSFLLTCLSLLPLLVVYPFLFKFNHLVGESSTEMYESYEQLYNNVLENMRGIRVIRANLLEDDFRKNFQHYVELCQKKTLRFKLIVAIYSPLFRVLPLFSMIIAFFIGFFQLQSNLISVGSLVTFIFYLNYLIWPFVAQGEAIQSYQQAQMAIKRIDELLAYPADSWEDLEAAFVLNRKSFDEVYELVQDALSSDKPPVLEVKNLCFQYDDGDTQAINDFSFTLKDGNSLGIVGATGSGKTTLALLLQGFYHAQNGALLWFGKRIEDWVPQELREVLAFVPQDHLIFSGSIRANLKFANEQASEEDLIRALELAAFDMDPSIFPDGLDTMIGEKGVTLSGGQKQRLSIARIFLKQSKVLILDDVLSAVDTRTETRILNNLLKDKNRMNIIIAHRLTAITHCQHILVLDQGRLVAQGNHEYLMEHSPWYQQIFLKQTENLLDEKEVMNHD